MQVHYRVLYRGDLIVVMYQEDIIIEEEHIEWENYNMDDVIDFVHEQNYSLILEEDKKRNNSSDFTEFCNAQENYKSLKEDEKILDLMFERKWVSKSCR